MVQNFSTQFFYQKQHCMISKHYFRNILYIICHFRKISTQKIFVYFSLLCFSHPYIWCCKTIRKQSNRMRSTIKRPYRTQSVSRFIAIIQKIHCDKSVRINYRDRDGFSGPIFGLNFELCVDISANNAAPYKGNYIISYPQKNYLSY